MSLLLLQTTDFWKGYNELATLTQGWEFVLPLSSTFESRDANMFDAWEAGDDVATKTGITSRGTYIKGYFSAYEDNLLGWYVESKRLPWESHFASDSISITRCFFWYSSMAGVAANPPADWIVVPDMIVRMMYFSLGG